MTVVCVWPAKEQAAVVSKTKHVRIFFMAIFLKVSMMLLLLVSARLSSGSLLVQCQAPL